MRNKQTGQAIIEYILITLMVVVALLVPIPDRNGNAIQLISQAIKQHYDAYKYAHSISTLPL